MNEALAAKAMTPPLMRSAGVSYTTRFNPNSNISTPIQKSQQKQNRKKERFRGLVKPSFYQAVPASRCATSRYV